MDPRSQELFNTHQADLLNHAIESFSLSQSSLAKKGSFESIVYEAEQEGRACILRFTHSLHRTLAQIEGELEFTEALAADGIPVSKSLLSTGGERVVRVDVEDGFFAILCGEKAPGKPTKPQNWTPTLMRNWGELTARMHLTAMRYEPSRPELRRFSWHDDPTLDFGRRIAQTEPIVGERFKETLAALRGLPVTPESFGLVHSDLHQGNFFVDGEQIHPFDFDDCHYNWFLQDIAMPLLYAHIVPSDSISAADSPRQFLDLFLEGYSRRKQIAEHDLRHLPLFLKLREIDLYAILTQLPDTQDSPWVKAFLSGRRARIEANLPVFDLS